MSDTAQVAAGMSGVFLTRLNPLRALVSVTILAVAMLCIELGAVMPPGFAMLAFGTALGLRYAFLFASFTRDGIAPRLKAHFGPELGFSVYESVTALLLFAQRLSFVWLLLATVTVPSGFAGTALVSSGALLALMGVAASVWATRVVGLDTYYYRDLFMGPQHVSFSLEGPYAIWRNPVYGAGQLAAYGVALMVLSPLAVLAVMLNQAALYAFNALAEQPHLQAATRLSIDTELRDTLSRTVIEMDRSGRAPGGWTSGQVSRALPPRKTRPPRSAG